MQRLCDWVKGRSISVSYIYIYIYIGSKWRRHGGGGGVGGSGPPTSFRPLLRFAQIHWEVFYV